MIHWVRLCQSASAESANHDVTYSPTASNIFPIHLDFVVQQILLTGFSWLTWRASFPYHDYNKKGERVADNAQVALAIRVENARLNATG